MPENEIEAYALSAWKEKHESEVGPKPVLHIVTSVSEIGKAMP